MYRFQDFPDSFFARFHIRDPLQYRLVIQVGMGRHVLIHPEFLRQVADEALQLLPLFLGVDAVDPDLPVALLQDAANDADHGGLSCTVGAQKSEHACSNVQAHAFECFEFLALFAQDGQDAHKPVEPAPASFHAG